jgi:hypothetical protein
VLAAVSADGDLSNIDPASALPSATGPSPHWHLVPFDNNIAQRNLAPVPGGGGVAGLAAAFKGRRFIARNPYKRPVGLKLEVAMPDFLRRRGWGLQFRNPGGAAFTLGPRASREIVLDITPGQEFTPAEVEAAGRAAVIDIHALIDNVPIGGMSYAIDPRLKTPPAEHPAGGPHRDCSDAAKRLLDCLGLPHDHVRTCASRRSRWISCFERTADEVAMADAGHHHRRHCDRHRRGHLLLAPPDDHRHPHSPRGAR